MVESAGQAVSIGGDGRAVLDAFAHPQVVEVAGAGNQCTGVQVASNAILTSAHCMNTAPGPSAPFIPGSPGLFSVKFANVSPAVSASLAAVNPTNIVFAVTEVIPHPGFTNNSQTSVDYGVLILQVPIPRSVIRPLAVTGATNGEIYEGYVSRVFGAGQFGAGCALLAPSAVTSLQAFIGAAGNGEYAFPFINIGSSLCHGDSGGPVLTSQPENGSHALSGVASDQIISVMSSISGNQSFAPVFDKLGRTFLEITALDRDRDGIDAANDPCDLVKAKQVDTDGDGSGDDCDPCQFDPNLEDADSDGVFDCVDICPDEDQNSETAPDEDDDGIPDCADTCLGEDLDGDGLCSGGAVALIDNCPNVADPLNRNANFLAEANSPPPPTFKVAHGDHCDPVPVPDFQVEPAVTNAENRPCFGERTCTGDPFCCFDLGPDECCAVDTDDPVFIQCHDVERTRLAVWPTRSQSKTDPNNFRNLLDEPTFAHFCLNSDDNDSRCADPVDFTEGTVRDANCFNGCANPELASHAYRRITFSQGGPSTPNGSVPLDYTVAPGRPFTTIPQVWDWQAQADFDRWDAANILPTDVTSIDQYQGGLAVWHDSELGRVSDPDGPEFQHDDDIGIRFSPLTAMPPGDFFQPDVLEDPNNPSQLLAQVRPIEQGICDRCIHLKIPDRIEPAFAQASSGPEAAAFEGDDPPGLFEEGPNPTQASLDAAATTGALAAEVPITNQFGSFKPFVVWRSGDLGAPNAYHQALHGGGEASIVVDSFGIPTAIRAGAGDCDGDPLHGRFRNLIDGMRLGTLWVNAAEPSSLIGEGPIAIALDEHDLGLDVADAVWTDGASLLTDADLSMPPREPARHMPPVRNAAVVYARQLRGLFVLGGQDVLTSRFRGRVWFRKLDESVWRVVPTPYRPAKVLAATFDFKTQRLYLLDERSVVRGQCPAKKIICDREQVQVHLVSLDPLTGEYRNENRWVRSREWDRQALGVELDGSLLLSSSNTREDSYAIARLNLDTLAVTGRVSGAGALLFPAIADGAGYTLAQRSPSDPVRIVASRVRALAPTKANLHTLDSQL